MNEIVYSVAVHFNTESILRWYDNTIVPSLEYPKCWRNGVASASRWKLDCHKLDNGGLHQFPLSNHAQRVLTRFQTWSEKSDPRMLRMGTFRPWALHTNPSNDCTKFHRWTQTISLIPFRNSPNLIGCGNLHRKTHYANWLKMTIWHKVRRRESLRWSILLLDAVLWWYFTFLWHAYMLALKLSFHRSDACCVSAYCMKHESSNNF